MNDVKKMFQFLEPSMKKCLIVIMTVALIGDLMHIWISYEFYNTPSQLIEPVCLHDWHIWIISIALLVLGFLYSAKEFNGYIHIMARRKEFLLGTISYMVLISIAMVLGNRLTCLVLTATVDGLLALPVDYFVNISFVKEWSLYVGMLSLGWCLGACCYRFRRVGILLSVGVGIEILMHLSEQVLNELLFETPDLVGTLIYLSILLGSIGWLFLYSAPIKRYTKG
ncbi:MAG: hypothetical protein E7231_14450 [Cellulosilyticum sp.]|nr:hypothetical protein [Cellulosilyticum sp.]